MKRVALFIALALTVVLGFKVAPATAESVVMASEKMSSVAQDQTVDGSAYLAGESVDVQGTVQGDVYCAGQTVTINGTVDGDVLCAGQSVTINGIVHGDVRAAGMTLMLKGQVDGSVTLAGMNISTDSASKIGRDATIIGNSIDLSGRIERDLMLKGSSATLNGPIGRDAKVEMDHLIVSDVKIGGMLAYVSNNEADIASGAVIGSVERTLPVQSATTSISLADVVIGMFIAVLAFSVLVVLLTLIAPRYVHEASDITGFRQFGTYFLIGLVGLLIAPIVLLMMVVTVIGVYAALVFGFAVILATFVGGVLVAYRLGRFMFEAKARPFVSALAGSLALGALCMIPYVGVVVVFATTSIGFGMILMSMRSQYNNTADELAVKPKRVTRRPKRQ